MKCEQASLQLDYGQRRRSQQAGAQFLFGGSGAVVEAGFSASSGSGGLNGVLEERTEVRTDGQQFIDG